MLKLARHVGEIIIIGNDIRIVVLKIKHSQVCLGVEAPKDISVHRLEIYDRIHNGIQLEEGY